MFTKRKQYYYRFREKQRSRDERFRSKQSVRLNNIYGVNATSLMNISANSSNDVSVVFSSVRGVSIISRSLIALLISTKSWAVQAVCGKLGDIFCCYHRDLQISSHRRAQHIH
jgi:hypothetical protein